ncbi:MAG TPA: MmgE/PrpD family protein, partial [Casimicrobiaceae bacterium]|nr:MmgE/PrpD family protein [Casimicrobiaceae bacterium]
IDEAAADITLTLRDGRRVHRRIEHAIGSLQRPMSDAALRDKFHRLVDPVLGTDAAKALIAACGDLARAESVQALVTAARPRAT